MENIFTNAVLASGDSDCRMFSGSSVVVGDGNLLDDVGIVCGGGVSLTVGCGCCRDVGGVGCGRDEAGGSNRGTDVEDGSVWNS